MARRRYYRRSVRVVAAKKKWASQMTIQRLLQANEPQSNQYLTLVQNSTETATPTPVVVKTGNFKVQVDAYCNFSAGERNLVNAIAFIAYVPQGYSLEGSTGTRYTVMQNFLKQHPEWVMCWKQLDFSSGTGTATLDSVSVSFSSRLKRNLNSGDKIIFGVAYQENGIVPSSSNSFTYQVACQYWTCSN